MSSSRKILSPEGHSWNGDNYIVCIFEKPYTVTEFLSFFDKLRLQDSSDHPVSKKAISDKASRLFYTFSGLHFLLKQVYALAVIGLNGRSSTTTTTTTLSKEDEELVQHFETCNGYFIEFTKILKIVELYYLGTIVEEEESNLLSNDNYVREVVKNDLMTELEKKVREDNLAIPYLFKTLESEGLDISLPLLRGMLSIS